MAPHAGPASADQPVVPVQVFNILTDFYERLDRGRYGELYDTVLESKWQALPDASCTYAGLVPREQFVTELSKEFDANGAGIIVMSYRVTGVSLVSDDGAADSAQPELAMLAHLPLDLQLQELYQLRVEGDLGPPCLPTRWSKQLYVARFAPEGWRLLLADSADPTVARKRQWFGESSACGRP